MRCCDFSRLTLAAFAGLPRSAPALGFAPLGRGRLGGLETNYHERSSRLTVWCIGSNPRFARDVLLEDHGILPEDLRARIEWLS